MRSNEYELEREVLKREIELNKIRTKIECGKVFDGDQAKRCADAVDNVESL
jgi:hypothetical protein